MDCCRQGRCTRRKAVIISVNGEWRLLRLPSCQFQDNGQLAVPKGFLARLFDLERGEGINLNRSRGKT